MLSCEGGGGKGREESHFLSEERRRRQVRSVAPPLGRAPGRITPAAQPSRTTSERVLARGLVLAQFRFVSTRRRSCHAGRAAAGAAAGVQVGWGWRWRWRWNREVEVMNLMMMNLVHELSNKKTNKMRDP